MISPSKVQEIERLLHTGQLSQRKVAVQVGVSRATVRNIALGTRPDYEARRLERVRERDEAPGPLERCRGCGGRVYMPCLLCRVRRIKAAELALRRMARPIRPGAVWPATVHCDPLRAAGSRSGNPRLAAG